MLTSALHRVALMIEFAYGRRVLVLAKDGFNVCLTAVFLFIGAMHTAVCARRYGVLLACCFSHGYDFVPSLA